jgi:hypothetical protein
LGESIQAKDVRMSRIKNTLELKRIIISEALVHELKKRPNVESIGELKEIQFDSNGDFL